MFVKICGLTDAASIAAACRADAVGFVFAPSPRRIAPLAAAHLAADLSAAVLTVAVFSRASQAEIDAVCADFRPDLVQVEPSAALVLPAGVGLLPVFHDHASVLDELSEFAQRHPGARVVLEGAAVGGQGVCADGERAALAARLPLRIIVAGGLKPDNVGRLIAAASPFGVDVSSGVESRRGVKSPEKIHRFIDAARAAARRAE